MTSRDDLLSLGGSQLSMLAPGGTEDARSPAGGGRHILADIE